MNYHKFYVLIAEISILFLMCILSSLTFLFSKEGHLGKNYTALYALLKQNQI
jgi:hypothetical protein